MTSTTTANGVGRPADEPRPTTAMSRSRRVLVATVAATLALAATCLTIGAAPQTAAAAPPGSTARLPTEDPANFTPNVLDGQVNSIWQVGNTVIIGGDFTKVANASVNGSVQYSRRGIAAFNATTGVVSTTFNPLLDGDVEVVIPSADAQSVYIAGGFNSINGINRRKVARISLTTGAPVAAFNANGVDGLVRDLRLVGNTLYMGGLFNTVNGVSRNFLASLDPTTGALTPKVDLGFAGLHNGGTGKVIKMDVTPDGSRMLITGNFTSINGESRDQVALVDLSTSPASLSPWSTTFFNSTCSSSFDSFMRDLDISEDGTFAVLTTTGAYRANTSCDTISRFEITDQAGSTPTWISYTGGDTTYAAEIHDGVVYLGGHMRWFNNNFAADKHGAGGVARDGMGAIDVVTGLPFQWNPGRTRGIGLFDYFVTDQGIWAGSNTDRFNGELRARLAFFPWAGGKLVPVSQIGDLPNAVFGLGSATGTIGAADASVLYRVNSGGPALTSVDDGPDWSADTATTSPYRNSGSNSSTARDGLAVPRTDSAVPKADFDRPNTNIWTTERWDPSTGDEMQWSFPVPAGTNIEVRLYLANRADGTNNGKERIFDISLDGVLKRNDLDLSGQIGHDVGTTLSYPITSDGSVDILFQHVVENPLINGIEIIQRGVTPTNAVGTSDSVVSRGFDGSTVTGLATAPGSVPWHTARGAFMVNSDLYVLHVDGSMTKRQFDGTTFGPGTTVDMWSNSLIGQNEIANMTGSFFDPSTQRFYYTVAGQSQLFYRPFLPESGIFHAQRYTAAGAIAALNPAQVRGMFLGNGNLYFGDAATGNLKSMAFANGQVSGTPTVADTTSDWRARALFRFTGDQPNVAPTAAFTSNCTVNVCSFDASTSTDADGNIQGYNWNFGDGTTGTGVTPQHSYATGGTFTVTLTVTDDDGAMNAKVDTVTVTAPANLPPSAVATASCGVLTCTFDGSGSSDPDGTIASYSWNFGDGTAPGSGVSVSHTYTTADFFDVVLTVTDNQGATATSTVRVQTTAPQAGVQSSGSASANSSTTVAGLAVPPSVASGDQLVYIVTANSSTSASTPPGWNLLATAQDGSPDMTSWVFVRTADGASAGSTVSTTLGKFSKVSRTLVAYRNAVLPTTAISSTMPNNTTELTTPDVTVGAAGSAVVSYWSDKTGSNTDWAIPPSVNLVQLSAGSGGGRITAKTADRITAPGALSGVTASSNALGSKGIGWTIVAAPAGGGGGNVPPVASFTSSCANLACSFDATASNDPDGTGVTYAWAFGDGGTATTVAPAHTYPAVASYVVTLTVTDTAGATNSKSSTITTGATSAVVFRAAGSTNNNTQTAQVDVPASVVAGDQLLLFVTTNANTTISTPAGWTLLGTRQTGAPDTTSWVFTRTADASVAGTSVQAALGTFAKTSTMVIAYGGAGPITTLDSSVAVANSAALATPAVTAVAGSTVVNYWSDKTSGNDGWALPGNVTGRSDSVGTGGGRITASAGDAIAPGGGWTGATATGTVAGAKAIGWSVVVPTA